MAQTFSTCGRTPCIFGPTSSNKTSDSCYEKRGTTKYSWKHYYLLVARKSTYIKCSNYFLFLLHQSIVYSLNVPQNFVPERNSKQLHVVISKSLIDFFNFQGVLFIHKRKKVSAFRLFKSSFFPLYIQTKSS